MNDTVMVGDTHYAKCEGQDDLAFYSPNEKVLDIKGVEICGRINDGYDIYYNLTTNYGDKEVHASCVDLGEVIEDAICSLSNSLVEDISNKLSDDVKFTLKIEFNKK